MWPIVDQAREFEAWTAGKDRETKILIDPNRTYGAFIRRYYERCWDGRVETIQQMLAEHAEKRLGADDVMMAVVQPDSSFGQDFKWCIIQSLFERNTGTAFEFLVGRRPVKADDYEAIVQASNFTR